MPLDKIINCVIFKTYSIKSNVYKYWLENIPTHDEYDIIVGEQIIPDFIIDFHKLTYPYTNPLRKSYYLGKCEQHIQNKREKGIYK